jgi:hypothetical protein
MKKFAALVFTLLFSTSIAHAQKDTASTGTITVKKKGQKRTLYDQVNDKLVLIDPYGKALDTSQVLSFDMVVAVNNKMTTISATGAFLTHEMKQQMLLASNGTIIYFKNIKAKNKKGEVENYPSTVVKADERISRDTVNVSIIEK